MLKILNIGPINGGAGDTAPVFGDKVNHMFNELYTREGVDPATKALPAARPISTGGTGATTAANARTNLDVPSKQEVESAIDSEATTINARIDDEVNAINANMQKISSMPLGVPLFHGGTRATIEAGHVPYDGQLLNRADYPAMWAKVQATFSIITDADWLANPSKRGSYSSGNGTTTFRMPDYNGVQPDSLKGLFLRGDGGGTIGGVAVSSGTVLNDAIRNITGTFFNGDAWNLPNPTTTGVFSVSSLGWSSHEPRIQNNPPASGGFTFDTSRQVPTAAENRPVSAVGVWICRVGNATTEVANPTLHAVLTGGNTFAGTQKMDAVQFNDLTTLRGLVSSMATGGADKVVTAEAIKAFYNLFAGSYDGASLTFKVPNVNDINKPMLIQMGSTAGNLTANTDVVITFPKAFPNSTPFVMVCNGDMIASSGAIIGVSQYIAKTAFAARTNVSGAQRINYIAIGN